MANPHHHAISSARKWGGRPDDYLAVHQWFDETKGWMPDFRHRAIRHHSEGIFECEQKFGAAITLSTCAKCGNPESDHPWRGSEDVLIPRECLEFRAKEIPVRWIGEQHVREDLGSIPTAADWLRRLSAEPWMNRSRRLSRELEQTEIA